MSKEKKQKKNKKKILTIIIIKIIIILFLALGYYHVNSSFSNSIYLLAVTEDNDGNPIEGSTIRLDLKIKPGSGQTFVNLNTVEEVDTQISVYNSQKIACRLFQVDCSSYDFFYTFKGSALVLKGPSASAAIAVLTAKTINKVKIDDSVTITGSLSSGGLIGNVGGIDKKIRIAKEEGFEKVLIPTFSTYNQSEEGIEVKRVLDIIEVYNNYGGDFYEIPQEKIKSESYENLMKSLSDKMCFRGSYIVSQVNRNLIKENSTEEAYLNQAIRSINSSNNAINKSSFYSAGSFCYNANINYRILSELTQNSTIQEINAKINVLRDEVNLKMVGISSSTYKKEILTINDLYIYLILNNRVEEARDIIKTAIDKKPIIQSSKENNLTQEEIQIANERLINEKKVLYSTALERLHTIELWEDFIEHTGTKIKFDDEQIAKACSRLNNELSYKYQLLDSYEIDLFNEAVNEQIKFNRDSSNKYLCLYNGLELNGRINTVLNSGGLTQNNSNFYIGKVLEITQNRLNLNTNGEFPLIPYIYYEYSGELLENEDVGSSMLYANYALSYTDLNTFLEEEKKNKAFGNLLIENLLNNIFFLGGLLVLLAFMSWNQKSI